MGFLLLIAFAMYGLGTICPIPEGKRQKNALENRPVSEGPACSETTEKDSRARRAASCRPRPGTGFGGRMYGHTAEEDDDGSDSEISIDELEYMRHFFH